MTNQLTEKIQIPKIPLALEKVIEQYLSYFILDGEPLNKVITEGQRAIFFSMMYKYFTRIEIICSTQYGKSLIVAIACLILTCVLGLKVAVVAPLTDKARIIMRYYIEHLGDHEIFYSQLEQNTKLDRLRQELSQTRITLRNGGAIYVISTQERNAKKSIESAMGEGAEVVIMDEACLISDRTEATIFRMISGKKNGRYIKIGNPFYSMPPYTHFKKAWDNPNYLHIFIDYIRGIQEGRYSEEFIEEARGKPLFDILYGSVFPDEDIMDEKGYYPLVVSSDIKMGIDRAIFKNIIEKDRDKNEGRFSHRLMIGCDIGGGGDYNTYIARYGSYGIILGYNQSKDTMVNISEIENIEEEFRDLGFKWENVNIDDIGIGRGVSDRLIEKGYPVNPTSVGDPSILDEFGNLKAELFWELRKWLKNENTRLDKSDKWGELLWIRYKVSSDREIRIEPKDSLKARTGKSPDFAEGLMLTFNEPTFLGFA